MSIFVFTAREKNIMVFLFDMRGKIRRKGGRHLPGMSGIYKSQTLEFLHPVFPGDTLCAWFEITAIDMASEEIRMKSRIENQDEKIVIQEQTTVTLLRNFKTTLVS